MREIVNPQLLVSEILRETLGKIAEKNPSYSARAFARDINLSPAYVSMILNGKKKLSLDRAEQISNFIGMKGQKKNSFLKAVALSSVASESWSSLRVQNLLGSKEIIRDVFPLEADRFQFFSNWYHVAILDLVTCNNFKNDIPWISSRLKISPSVAACALDRLIRLGLLEKKGRSLVKIKSHVSVPTKKSLSYVRSFHSQMIDKAKQNLNSSGENEFQSREISGITMAVNPDHIPLAKEKIKEFKKEISKILTEGSCTEVFQMNIQLFPLTDNSERATK